MSDLLNLRRHRFDALHAFLVGDIRNRSANRYIENSHLRRDLGFPETELRPTSLGLGTPMIGLRR